MRAIRSIEHLDALPVGARITDNEDDAYDKESDNRWRNVVRGTLWSAREISGYLPCEWLNPPFKIGDKAEITEQLYALCPPGTLGKVVDVLGDNVFIEVPQMPFTRLAFKANELRLVPPPPDVLTISDVSNLAGGTVLVVVDNAVDGWGFKVVHVPALV